ncbi:MAG: Holliday junction resolvase RuvX [Candidatus Aminicenantes bacterium]|nr:Holliday junction resolvase RuvX [Candidatus Aminicenantes bacterium]
MRILGVDFGDRNVGLALSDTLGLTAQPLMTYRLRGGEEDARFFQDLVKTHDVSKIVIGLPVRLDGTPGRRSKKTEEFARWLKETLRLPVTFTDERLTTRQALQAMKEQRIRNRERRSVENQISASLILASYLESRRKDDHDS